MRRKVWLACWIGARPKLAAKVWPDLLDPDRFCTAEPAIGGAWFECSSNGQGMPNVEPKFTASPSG
jgi:hypothetical protein